MLERLKEEACKANILLDKYHLITMTWGNVSVLDTETGILAIKPSGVSYDEMKPEDMVLVRVSDGEIVEGKLNPSSDLPTHLVLYREFPGIQAVVHTHSPFATAFAQSKMPIPALGTTHADHFYGEIPVTRNMTKEEIENDYEYNTGVVIAETFREKKIDPLTVPAVLVASHGVFNWGASGIKAVENALVTERVAEMALYGKNLGADNTPIAQELLDKHYLRKHGPNAYYGQSDIL